MSIEAANQMLKNVLSDDQRQVLEKGAEEVKLDMMVLTFMNITAAALSAGFFSPGMRDDLNTVLNHMLDTWPALKEYMDQED